MFRILIAEDDPSTARLLGAIVKRAGYEPLIAADGVQALEMLDHNHIDLLLCDVMMPRMDGFTLTRTIREDAHRQHQRLCRPAAGRGCHPRGAARVSANHPR